MIIKEFIKRNKEKLILSGGAIGIGIISLAITLTVYNIELSRYDSNDIELSKNDETKIEQMENNSDIVFNQDLTEEQKVVAENLIAKLDELEKNKNIEAESSNSAIQNNIEKSSNKSLESNVANNINNNEIQNVTNLKPIDNSESVNKIEDIDESINNNEMENGNEVENEIQDNVVEVFANKNKENSFIRPIDGEIGMKYSDKNLVYSKTLDEWINHTGIDFLAQEGTEVKAIEDGIIKNFYKDERYGYTIEVEHDNNYVSKYSGLQQEFNLEIGDRINKGDIISKIGEAYGFEKEEGCHLHFEIIKNDKNINPDFI